MELDVDRRRVENKNKRVPRGILIFALFGIILWELSAARAFVVPICLAALLAFLMNPLDKFFCKHRAPEWASILISVCILFLPLLLVLSLLAYEIRLLILDFPAIV